ncbi:C-type mannose receptor 2 [Amia ocellicauda]|uniref:C-type mannose receptor 2 n=1 Tax=Amia ocellicauda TaxID=2972642 RepID=UPI003463E828
MERRAFLILLFSGLSSLSSCLARQYVFVNKPLGWSDAQQYCREKHTDLASIDNAEELDGLLNTADSAYTGQAWIGLYYDMNSWQWSLTDSDFCSERKSEYSNWATGQPDNSGVNENCVYMFAGSQWHDDICIRPYPFICYNESSNATQRYIRIDQNMTWTEAQRFCREHYTDLVSVRSQSENEEVKKAANGQHVWIGLNRDPWKWSDQTSSSFRNWYIGQPDSYGGSENCAEVYLQEDRKGKWNDIHCTESHPFFCSQGQLFLIRENKSWEEAVHYCRANYTDLGSVGSAEWQRLVTQLAQNASSAQVWLGLRYTCTLGFWFWVSGEPLCYSNFAPGIESKCSCDQAGALTVADGNWIALPYSQQLNFICYRGPASG